MISYIIQYLYFNFDRKSVFVMHWSSNQMVPNLDRVASVLLIVVTAFQWAWKNHPHVSRMSLTNSLFMTIFTVDWLSISSHHSLTALPDPWFLFPLLRNEYSSVPPRMHRSLPVMPASIISDAKYAPQILARTSQSPPHSCRYLPLLGWTESGYLLLPIWDLWLLLSWI